MTAVPAATETRERLGEEWRPVAGWEDRYEVSNLGRVRGITRYGSSGRILGQIVVRQGYVRVRFFRGGKKSWKSVHRLVAEAFLDRQEGQHLVRHLNGDKLDNQVGNLAWGTDAENIQDQVRHGTHFWAGRTHCLRGHALTGENLAFRPDDGTRRCRTCTIEQAKRWRRSRATQAVAS